jgi:hypothetical protein
MAKCRTVLLGDSIFDNARYTSGGPAVESQVRKLLPSKWNLTLLAVDGSSTDDIPGQMLLLPNDATHLVLSVGGQRRADVCVKIGFFVVRDSGHSRFKHTRLISTYL